MQFTKAINPRLIFSYILQVPRKRTLFYVIFDKVPPNYLNEITSNLGALHEPPLLKLNIVSNIHFPCLS